MDRVESKEKLRIFGRNSPIVNRESFGTVILAEGGNSLEYNQRNTS